MISYAFCAPQKSITKPPTPKAASASPSESTPFFPTTEAEPSEVCANTSGNGRIEAKVRLNQDRCQFFALYLVRRTIFFGSSIQKILFCYSKDASCGSLDTELVSWLWFAESLIHILCIGAFPAVGMNFLKRPVDMTLEFSHGGATLHPPLPTSPCARK